MYSLARIALCTLLWIILAICLSHQMFASRKCLFLSIVVCLILIVPLHFLPVENVFLVFDSPEEAYQYYVAKPQASFAIRGEDSAFVVGYRGNTEVSLIVPEDDGNGWKIGIGSDTQLVDQIVVSDAVLYVFQHRTTEDIYVSVVSTSGQPLHIADSIGSDYMLMESAEAESGISKPKYYAYIDEINNSFWISVNGNLIKPGFI